MSYSPSLALTVRSSTRQCLDQKRLSPSFERLGAVRLQLFAANTVRRPPQVMQADLVTSAFEAVILGVRTNQYIDFIRDH